MRYGFHEIQNTSDKKYFLSEIQEIISILHLLYHVTQNIDETLYQRVLLRIGIIDLPLYLDKFESMINKSDLSTNILKEAFTVHSINICTDDPQCSSCVINNYCNYYRTNSQIAAATSSEPTLVDLFCGAGGLSLGFKQEGFRILVANDIEEACVNTYIHNHPEVPKENVLLGDIELLSDDIVDLLNNTKVDIIIGGPPCQGFSMANRQRLIDDPRNKLYKNFVQLVNKLAPKFFVMENVKGMLPISHQVVEDFHSLYHDYNVHYEVLNAKDFGVPQNRERLIFIGNRLGLDSKEIFATLHNLLNNTKKSVLKDAIQDLRELRALTIKNSTEIDTEESGRKIDLNTNISPISNYISIINDGKPNSIIYNHKARYNNERDIEIFSRLNQGDKSDDPKIADIMPYKNRSHIFKDKYFKLENEKECKTITAHMKFDCNMYIHPTQARGLTPREAARIQSYPDEYFFKGPYTKTYMQIGNSVPPLMARMIAKAIKEFLKN